jgi:hypothetical protein
MTELSLCLGLILIILYGLFSMTVTENLAPVSLAGANVLVPGKQLSPARYASEGKVVFPGVGGGVGAARVHLNPYGEAPSERDSPFRASLQG